MWPDLFGTGSELGLLVAGSTLAGLAAFVWLTVRTARPLGPDPVTDLWQRYEQGDLTSWEAVRLFRIFAGQQAAAEEVARQTAPAWRTETEPAGRATAWR